jgi:hypothetical protein
VAVGIIVFTRESFVSISSMSGAYEPLLLAQVEAALFQVFLTHVRGIFLNHATVEEVNRALSVSSVAGVMRDHADGGAFFVQTVEQTHDGLAVLGVQVARGLVSEENRRGPADGSGHSDALLLTA